MVNDAMTMMMRVVIRGKIMNLRDVAWRCVQIYHTQPIFVNGQTKEEVPLEHHKYVPASNSIFYLLLPSFFSPASSRTGIYLTPSPNQHS